MPSAARIKRKRDEDVENNAKKAGSCFTSSLQGMYIVFVIFQTAILKLRNRNSYEYINCTYGSVLGKITSVFIYCFISFYIWGFMAAIQSDC